MSSAHHAALSASVCLAPAAYEIIREAVDAAGSSRMDLGGLWEGRVSSSSGSTP